MKPLGSKHSGGPETRKEIHAEDRAAGASPGDSGGRDPEVSSSLEVIISAFVDIGFGASAPQQAQRAANDNAPMKAIAEDFKRNAA